MNIIEYLNTVQNDRVLVGAGSGYLVGGEPLGMEEELERISIKNYRRYCYRRETGMEKGPVRQFPDFDLTRREIRDIWWSELQHALVILIEGKEVGQVWDINEEAVPVINNMQAGENLRNAIVERALDDYKACMLWEYGKQIGTSFRNSCADKGMKEDVERFFSSKHFLRLTGFENGPKLLDTFRKRLFRDEFPNLTHRQVVRKTRLRITQAYNKHIQIRRADTIYDEWQPDRVYSIKELRDILREKERQLGL